MKFLTLDNVKDLEGRLVLLRIDINSPILNGKIQNNERIKEHAKTINELIRKKAKIVIIAHQGRKGQSDFTSLKEHAKLISRYTIKKINFVSDILGNKALMNISLLKKGQAILLENLRYLDEENKDMNNYDNSKLVSMFKDIFDLFVFDGFSVSHRNSASVTGLGNNIITVAGRVMEKELNNLNKLEYIKRPYVMILGGDKPDDVVNLIESKINDVDYVLTGGILAELCLMAKGIDLGAKSVYIRSKGYDDVIPRIKKFVNSEKIIIPYDFAVEKNNKRIEMGIKLFPSKLLTYDLGKMTIINYKSIIVHASTIYMKGPLSHYEMKGFDHATKEILKAVAKSKSFSIVGGGHTLDSVNKYTGHKKIGYTSLAGGALLDYMAGKKLPGLMILESWANRFDL